jgi:hypothetical protein
MSANVKTALTAILVSLLVLPSCGADEQARTDGEEKQASTTATRAGAERTVDQTSGERATGELAAGRKGGARARAGDNAVARSNGGEDVVGTNTGRAQEITLKVGGDNGTRFSGVCSVGGEEKVIGGRIPARYDYHLGGDKLECEIRKESRGALEVVLAAGSNVRSVQRTGAQNSTINFAYSSSGSISSSIHGSPG